MHAKKVAARAAHACLLLAGLWILERAALAAFGGRERLMAFESNEGHRFTSMAMLHGTLKLRAAISLLWHDEQVFNGAVYTNWGFGVPLLQLPFHAIAARFPRSFPQTVFPDRAIFFSYLAASIPVIWAAFDRFLGMFAPLTRTPVRRNCLSWAATSLALTCSLYPLIASRFIVYEEAIAYFVVCELLALSGYLFALRSWSPLAVGALGFAAGFGLLIRPIGLIYMALWVGLVIVEARRRQALVAFAAGAAPLLAFWMFTNWVRSGSPIGLGTSNSLPWYPYHTAFLRFGNGCTDTLGHLWEAASRLFGGLFLGTGAEPTAWMKQCHYDFEEQPLPRGITSAHEPIFGATVVVLVGWMLLHLLATRERKLSTYAPFVALLVLFAAYAATLAGFAWRYSFDFWPAIVLACVQYARALPAGGRRVLGLPLAAAFAAGSMAVNARSVEPFQSTIEVLSETKSAAVLETFHRMQSTRDALLPSHIACADRPTAPFHNGLGWNADCSVDTFTNVYLGVLAKGDDRYDLWFTAEGTTANKLRVYVNGRYYDARRDGAAYHAIVEIPYERLNSPVVVVTVQWARGLEPPKVKLLSIELS